MLHSLENMTGGRDRYIALQLYIPAAVRVYDPGTHPLQQNRVTCNYIDYQSTQSTCAHLFVSEYLIYTVLPLFHIVAFYTLECCVERRPARNPARSKLDAGSSSLRIKFSEPSN